MIVENYKRYRMKMRIPFPLNSHPSKPLLSPEITTVNTLLYIFFQTFAVCLILFHIYGRKLYILFFKLIVFINGYIGDLSKIFLFKSTFLLSITAGFIYHFCKRKKVLPILKKAHLYFLLELSKVCSQEIVLFFLTF